MKATFTTGALVASIAAGPVVLVQIVLLSMNYSPIDARTLTGLPIPLILATFCGFVISLVPNFVGAASLSAAGRRHPGFRHPSVWAATGFLAGWLLAAVVGGFDPGIEAVVIGVTGLVCALVSRRFAAWED